MDDQKKWIVVVVICLLLGGAYWYFVFQKQSETVTKKTNELRELQKKINTAESQVKRLDELLAEKAELEAQLAESMKYLPTSDEIEKVLKNIELAIRDSDLKKINFSPGTPEPYEKFLEQNIGISLEGEFPNFLAFLDRLEKMDRIVRPRNINIKLKTDRNKLKDKTFTLTINLVISAYIQQAAQEGGSAAK